MKRSEFIELAGSKVIIGDGAMGSYLASMDPEFDEPVEMLNLKAPDLVASAHADYVASGAVLVETNTFAANRYLLERHGLGDRVAEINSAGVAAARRGTSGRALVAGSVGPVSANRMVDLTEDEISTLFKEQVAALIDASVDLIILETFSSVRELELAFESVMEVCADIAVVCQVSASAGPGLVDRVRLHRLAELASAGAAGIGVNCSSGPSAMVSSVRTLTGLVDAPISVFPNASIPEVVDGRSHYVADPRYFGQYAARLVGEGVRIVGGCCGTTPAHIKSLAEAVSEMPHPALRSFSMAVARSPLDPGPRSGARTGLIVRPDVVSSVEPTVVVELHPPKGPSVGKMLEAGRQLAQLRVDAFSVPESPGARVRMDSLVAGHLLQRETGIPAIVHMTCRDRNLIGQQARLLGLSALDIHAVLVVTGDRAANQSGGRLSGIYETSSFGLIEAVQGFNAAFGGEAGGLSIGCAFNANARNIGVEVERLRRKVSLGATFAVTQPVFDPDQVAALREAIEDIHVPILVGVLPIVSLRNAEVLNNEFPGIRIPDHVMAAIRGLPLDAVVDYGVQLACEVAEAAVRHFSGVYIIPPFNRVDVASPVVRHVRRS